MKLVWSPEMAEKAFMDTVKSCDIYQGSSITELISAMAAGWNARLIVETWCLDDETTTTTTTTTSIGLAVASTHTCGRHVCIVPNEDSKTAYLTAMNKAGMSPEVIVGEPEKVVNELEFIDFLLIDLKKINEFDRILKAAKFGRRGAVVVCLNGGSTVVLDGGSRRIVRSVFIPVGNGLDIAHVAGEGSGSGSGKVKNRRWIKRVDRESGEEFLIRK
ncbi:hypothetical protein QVD17_13391 [Tagetes erecta]|uniref:Uncharacterized protein n=1 Tax=Tagetes erecta TaxID=13708 RepID=A0AAD8KW00_TARER|nr:hypothetical protein QVD17_13391 [Tagetes erecta]